MACSVKSPPSNRTPGFNSQWARYFLSLSWSFVYILSCVVSGRDMTFCWSCGHLDCKSFIDGGSITGGVRHFYISSGIGSHGRLVGEVMKEKFCHGLGLEPGPLAFRANALPLSHPGQVRVHDRINLLELSFLTSGLTNCVVTMSHGDTHSLLNDN